MKIIAFVIFLIVTIMYVWNGRDNFDKKMWLKFGVKFVLLLFGVIILGFTLKLLVSLFSGFTNEMAGRLMMQIALSFTFILGMKFLVVMACTMFSRMMSIHKTYNTENYGKLSSLSNRFAPGLLLLAKVIVSLGSALIFYGIWLA